jgi:nicotinamide riboside kinase
MLVTIIGSPCSGKTTCAAKAFAYLKEQGILTEFISEQARWHIAEKRWHEKLKPEDPIVLTNKDQGEIMERQFNIESILKVASGPGTIVLSDSSALNALLYIDESIWNSSMFGALAKGCLEQYDLVFYCKPLPHFVTNDPNRAHDKQASLEIDARIPRLIEKLGIKIAGVIETAWERDNLAMEILAARAGL